MSIPGGWYAVLLPALGFLGAAVIGDFLKWRSDVRQLHIRRMEMCTDDLTEIMDMVRINVGRGFDGELNIERSPAIHLHALLSLYLPSCTSDSSKLIDAYGEFESAAASIRTIWNDPTMSEAEREHAIRSLVTEKGEPLGELVEKIGAAIGARHARLQKWWSLP